MILEIRKKGTLNFLHIYNNKEYVSSDLNIDAIDNNVMLTKENGAYILSREGFDISIIRVYDDTSGGAEENFATPTLLFNRLIALGYPAFLEVGTLDVNIINGNA